MSDKEEIVVLTSSNYREWHQAIRAFAEDQNVWEYVDTESTNVLVALDEPPSYGDYSLEVTTSTGDSAVQATLRVTRLNQLSTAQKEQDREDMTNYRYSEQRHDK